MERVGFDVEALDSVDRNRCRRIVQVNKSILLLSCCLSSLTMSDRTLLYGTQSKWKSQGSYLVGASGLTGAIIWPAGITTASGGKPDILRRLSAVIFRDIAKA